MSVKTGAFNWAADMPFQYKSRPKANLVLGLLDAAVDNHVYASVLSTLANGIRTAIARIENAEQKASSEIAQFVTEDEVEVIENMLGTAYVLCQTPITAVTRAALRARQQALADGTAPPGFGEKPHHVRAVGHQFVAQYTKIEILWELANYFKHRDEWPRSAELTEEWRRTIWKPTEATKYTLPVLEAVGIEPSSTGNLRTGAEALGITDYANLTVLEEIISRWANEVRSLTRSACGR